MATRIVTFLSPDGPPPLAARQFEFDGVRSAPTRNHLPLIAERGGQPCVILAMGAPEARRRWRESGVLREGWSEAAPALGFRELHSGSTEAERWAAFTALATALAETPLSYEPFDGGPPSSEPGIPSQIILDITHAPHEIPFLAASVVSFLQHQRRRNNAASLSLRVLHSPHAQSPSDPAPIAELTQLLSVLSWEAAAAPRSGKTTTEPTDRLGGWARRAKTMPAVPWAISNKPKALNLTGRPVASWSPAESEAAHALGLSPGDFDGPPLAIDPHAPTSEVEQLADRVVSRVLDEQLSAAFLDAEPTLAFATAARLQRAGVRCFGLVRKGADFASWREFPGV